MIRRSVAGVILGVSLLVGSFAWAGFVSLRTVLDPDRSADVAEELLDNEEVRLQLIDNIAGAITVAIPAEIPVEDAAVQQAAQAALANPELEALWLTAFAATHAAFLGEGDAPQNLDLTVVATRARDALVQASPSLDAVLPAAPVLNIPLPTEHVPDVSPLRSFLQRVVPIMAIGAIGGAVVALVSTTDRPAILRRAGFWALTTTAVYLLIGLGIPWLLRRVAPDGAEVVAALLTAMLRSVRMPSIVLGVVGAGLLVSSMAWSTASRAGRSERPRKLDRDAPSPRRSATAGRAVANVGQPVPPGPVTSQAYPPGYPPQQGAPSRGAPSPGYPARPATAGQPVGGHPDPGSPVPYPEAGSPGPYPDSAADPTSVFADIPPPRDAPPPPPGAATPDAPARSMANASTPDANPNVAFAPRWVAGHGWVLHPDDPRPLPASATWVDGVGHVVPGPPPDQR